MTRCDENESESEKRVRQARKLRREGHAFEARRILLDGLSINGQSADLFQELAEIECAEENYSAASSHLADAATLEPFSAKIACNRVKVMMMAELYSEARSIADNLPEKLRSEPSVRVVLGDLYRAIGWHAHAVEAYGRQRDLPPRAIYLSSLSWLRTGGPIRVVRFVMRKEENNIDDAWKAMSIERHETLMSLNLPLRKDITRIHMEIDTCSLVMLKAVGRLYSADKRADNKTLRLGYLGFISLLALTLVYIFRRPVQDFDAAALEVLYLTDVTMIIIYAIRFLIKRIASQPLDKENDWYSSWPLLAAFAGLAVSAVTRPHTFPATVGLVAIITGISYRVGWGSNDRWENAIAEVARRRPRAFALNSVLYVVKEITDPDQQNNVRERSQWIANLRDAARSVERFLPRAFQQVDPVIRGQIVASLGDAAMRLRVLAWRIATPEEQTWSQLIIDLRHNATAIAIGDFGNLLPAQISLLDQVPTRRRRTVINIVMVATALMLLGGLIAILIILRKRSMVNVAETTAVTTFVAVLVGVLARPLQGDSKGNQPSANKEPS